MPAQLVLLGMRLLGDMREALFCCCKKVKTGDVNRLKLPPTLIGVGDEQEHDSA